jgi:pyruvate,water dikinase
MFTVDRETRTVLKRDISRKDNRMTAEAGGGISLEQVPEDEQGLSSLDDTAIIALCNYGLILEEYFRGPQAIEWAMENSGNLFILQSRPLSMSPAPAYHCDAGRPDKTAGPNIWRQDSVFGRCSGQGFQYNRQR